MNMNFPSPNKGIFTIYTKTKCEYCTKSKILLEDNDIEYLAINCDEYLMNSREEFLGFIKKTVGKDWKTFPIIFDDNGVFIGGFIETQQYLEKKLDFSEDF